MRRVWDELVRIGLTSLMPENHFTVKSVTDVFETYILTLYIASSIPDTEEEISKEEMDALRKRITIDRLRLAFDMEGNFLWGDTEP